MSKKPLTAAEEKKANCYECIHRRKILGDAHSNCVAEHQKVSVNITPNEWSLGFPSNYDPRWIKSCKSFESKIEHLRETTGHALMVCKMALSRFNDNVDDAKSYLQSSKFKQDKLIHNQLDESN